MLATYVYTQKVFARFNTVATQAGRTGGQVAREILDNEGLSDVLVVASRGAMADRYSMKDRSVNLTPMNFNSVSVAAIGVAAHEVGHAIQVRDSSGIPLKCAVWALRLAGWGSLGALSLTFVGLLSGWPDLWLSGTAIFLVAMFLSALAIPIEMDASRRGLKWLKIGQYLNVDELQSARTVLRAAALSYFTVVGTTSVVALRDMIWRGDDSP